jgi:hypothetical protein
LWLTVNFGVFAPGGPGWMRGGSPAANRDMASRLSRYDKGTSSALLCSHSEKEKHQQNGCDARAHGPEDVPSIPTGLEVLARAPARRPVHYARIEPLKLIVQGDVDGNGGRLHAEHIDERGGDDEQPIGSAQLSCAKDRRHYQC